MKTIGLIGGMSWESSAEYYRIINQTVKERLGGLHSARVLLYSVDFAEIAEMQHSGRWADAADVLVDAAKRLEAGGADLVVLCTNTMHKVADTLSSALSIPFVHIADPTGEALKARGVQTVALLGTAFTMEQDFYKARLTERYGLRVIVPDEADRKLVHDVIYQELCLGQVRPESRAAYRDIMARLVAEGAEAIILGCTEIELLVHAEDAAVPLFDTTHLHAIKAVELALSAGRPGDDVKEIVKQFWARRAAEFDREPDHVLHTGSQHQAWLELLARFCEHVSANILDLGCGTGFLAFLYAELGHDVTGIDLAPEMIDIAQQKAALQGVTARFRVGDAECITEPDQSCDLVVARHLLWTLPDPSRAVNEWLRVLKPNGRLLLIEGHWGIGDLSGEYGQIHAHFPFFGGALGEKVAAFLRTCGLEDVRVEPLMAPDLWHEPPQYPRYLVTGKKTAR